MSDDPWNGLVVSHAIGGPGGYDGWLETFKGLCNEGEEGFHTKVVKASYSLAGKCSEQRDGKDTIIVLHIFPSSNEDTMKDMSKFDGPPFVGGPDLIKIGVVIPPFDPLFQFKVGAAMNHAEVQEPLMFFLGVHAISDYEEWYTKAFEPAITTLVSLGVVRSIVGQGPDSAEGKPQVVVIFLFNKSFEGKVRDFFSLKGPPFVGGPDLIKNGLVIPPWTHEIYGSVDYTHTY